MPWPTVPVVTTGMDADTDTLPRADILDHTNKFNQLIAMRGVADGVCDLDGSARVPNARLDPTLNALAGTLTGANKIPYATAPDTAGELNRSTDGTLAGNSDLNLPTEKAVKAYVDARPFSVSYTSPTPSALSTALILETHSLGGVPKLMQVSLRCTTADAGYSVNDEIYLSSDDAPGFNSVTTWSSATQVGINISGSIRVAHKSTLVTTALTSANWVVVLRAWR